MRKCAIEKSKTKLLEHYEQKNPTLFIQYDGFLDRDDMFTTDNDGHSVLAMLTYELMSGGPDVRVLITPETSKEAVIQLLGKIMDCIKEDDPLRPQAKEELRKITKLKEIENEMQEVSENEDIEDVEYLSDSIQEILDKKKQAKNITDEEVPF